MEKKIDRETEGEGEKREKRQIDRKGKKETERHK